MLQAKNITKKWGQTIVLDELSLSLSAGTITAIIGPNGCGKTTLFRMLAGIITPTSGTITRSERLENCFFFQGNEMLYDYLTGYDHLQFIEAMYQSTQSLAKLTTELQLTAWVHRKVKHYSLGMKQQLLFAMALLSEASFYILDEPFNGLDVIVTQRLQRQLIKLKKQGATIVFSSHQLSESDQLADQRYFMKAGQLTEPITTDTSNECYQITLNRTPIVSEIAYLTSQPNVHKLELKADSLMVTLTSASIHCFFKSCVACQLTIMAVTIRQDETRRAYEAFYGEEANSNATTDSL